MCLQDMAHNNATGGKSSAVFKYMTAFCTEIQYIHKGMWVNKK